MTRPDRQQSADLRILEAASGHLRTLGPTRLTIVAIAEELGMSHSNVYRYFPSKAGLLEALTAQWLGPIETGLRSVSESQDPARDKLERGLSGLYRAYRDKLDSDPRVYEVFVELCRERSPLARRHRGRILTEVRRMIDEGVSAGAIVGADPARTLTLIVDMTYRFTDPIAVADDRDTSKKQLSDRFERVLDCLLEILKQRQRLGTRPNN